MKFRDYNETLPKLLSLLKFDQEIKRHVRVVLKPNVIEGVEGTSAAFIEPVLKFCMQNKNPGTEIVIAEGCDGVDTTETFEKLGYKALAEKYGVGLVDLNKAETKPVTHHEYLRFEEIQFPTILQDSFVISLPKLTPHEELGLTASLDSMIGAYPSRYYKGFFTKKKSKIRQWPLKYSVHDILKCKMPDFAIIDASDKGLILAGKPLDMDKQAAKLMGNDWKEINHLRLVDESFAPKAKDE